MPRATVTVKEGISYRWKSYVFTTNPTYVTDANDIAELKTIGVLNVAVDQDKPLPVKAAPNKAKAPEPKETVPAEEDLVDEDTDESAEDDAEPEPEPEAAAAEETPPAPKKPGPKPGFKPGQKAKQGG